MARVVPGGRPEDGRRKGAHAGGKGRLSRAVCRAGSPASDVLQTLRENRVAVPAHVHPPVAAPRAEQKHKREGASKSIKVPTTPYLKVPPVAGPHPRGQHATASRTTRRGVPVKKVPRHVYELVQAYLPLRVLTLRNARCDFPLPVIQPSL